MAQTEFLDIAFQLGKKGYTDGVSYPMDDPYFIRFIQSNQFTPLEFWLLKKQWLKAYNDSSNSAMIDMRTKVLTKHLT